MEMTMTERKDAECCPEAALGVLDTRGAAVGVVGPVLCRMK